MTHGYGFLLSRAVSTTLLSRFFRTFEVHMKGYNLFSKFYTITDLCANRSQPLLFVISQAPVGISK